MDFLPYTLKWLELVLRWGHVLFAIKDAIASIGDYKITPIINGPATPEKILMSIKNLEKNL